MDIKELIERRAEHIYKWSEGGQAWCDLHEGQKNRWIGYAELALDDPDLALIDREKADRHFGEDAQFAIVLKRNKYYPVIPLAEAIRNMEVKDGK